MNKSQKFYYYIGTILIFLGTFVIISSFYNTIKWLWTYGLLIDLLGLLSLTVFNITKASNSTDEKEEKDNEEVSE
jgi:hypothetical protein